MAKRDTTQSNQIKHMNKLHRHKAVKTRQGIKMPFTLAKPMETSAVALRIKEATGHNVVRVHMTTFTFGYVTLAMVGS